LLKTSVIEPLLPANTVTAVPVVVLLPVEVDRPLLALPKLAGAETVAVSPDNALTHVLTRVSCADLRVLVWVQVIAVSAAPTVKVVPLKPLLPVQANVEV
jgi:hypothetical protein